MHGAHVSVSVSAYVKAPLAEIALVEFEVEVGELVVVHVALFGESFKAARFQTNQLLVLALRFVVLHLLCYISLPHYFLQPRFSLSQAFPSQFLLQLVKFTL